MKAHIAQVHYQLQNIENLDSFDISEIAKRIDTLAFDKKKIGQIEHENNESLRENALNVHIRRSENQTIVKQSEEFIQFLRELNAEFPGPQLVLVLDFLQDLKETHKTDQLEKIIEEGRSGNYRRVFEDLEVFQTNHSTKTKTLKKATSKMEVDKKEKFKEEKVKKDMVVMEMVKKEKVKIEMVVNEIVKKEKVNIKKVKSQTYFKNANEDLEKKQIQTSYSLKV